jgi:hypothetical protein
MSELYFMDLSNHAKNTEVLCERARGHFNFLPPKRSWNNVCGLKINSAGSYIPGPSSDTCLSGCTGCR